MRLLFVCLGNICRSPAAEGVMKELAKGMDIEIDSAGTAGYHTGELPDPRMRSHARKRGIELTSRSAHPIHPIFLVPEKTRLQYTRM